MISLLAPHQQSTLSPWFTPQNEKHKTIVVLCGYKVTVNGGYRVFLWAGHIGYDEGVAQPGLGAVCGDAGPGDAARAPLPPPLRSPARRFRAATRW